MRLPTLGLAACLTLTAPAAMAVTNGQRDSFDGGSLAGWTTGANSPIPPTVQLGGPGAVPDPFMLAASTGGVGPGSRLVVFNDTQWTGDYLTAGVTGIAMDVNNLGPTDLSLHLEFERDGASPLLVAAPADLPSGSGWMHVFFDLGSAVRAGQLGAVTRLRLLHTRNGAFPPPAITATLGIDNVSAVPLPPSLVLCTGGVVALLTRLRRRAA